MLRLQRGNPIIHINPADAALKGIRDGDRVKVFNDIGHFFAMAKLVPGVALNTLVMEHAWEPCQFEDGYCKNDVVAGIITPMELIGDFGHISFSPEWDGNQLAFESSVDLSNLL